MEAALRRVGRSGGPRLGSASRGFWGRLAGRWGKESVPPTATLDGLKEKATFPLLITARQSDALASGDSKGQQWEQCTPHGRDQGFWEHPDLRTNPGYVTWDSDSPPEPRHPHL